MINVGDPKVCEILEGPREGEAMKFVSLHRGSRGMFFSWQLSHQTEWFLTLRPRCLSNLLTCLISMYSLAPTLALESLVPAANVPSKLASRQNAAGKFQLSEPASRGRIPLCTSLLTSTPLGTSMVSLDSGFQTDNNCKDHPSLPSAGDI